MTLISQDIQNELKTLFQQALTSPVYLEVFTQTLSCEYCPQVEQMVKELEELHPHIHVNIRNFQLDKDAVARYNVEGVPAIIILDSNKNDTGIRFYGIPSGYEFESLIGAILDTGNSSAHLFEPHLLDEIKKIESPIKIEVFVTPTCPYCPGMVRLAHKLALTNENIQGVMVEAIEFPEKSQRFGVRGVPLTVVQEDMRIEGLVPEEHFLTELVHWYQTRQASSQTV